jgi:threonine/homoserine efflux transporter RhtA
MIIVAMFSQTHAVQVFIVKPIDVGMGVMRVSCSTIDLATLHRPQVGHYINIMLCDIRAYGVHYTRMNAGEHCLTAGLIKPNFHEDIMPAN